MRDDTICDNIETWPQEGIFENDEEINKIKQRIISDVYVSSSVYRPPVNKPIRFVGPKVPEIKNPPITIKQKIDIIIAIIYNFFKYGPTNRPPLQF